MATAAVIALFIALSAGTVVYLCPELLKDPEPPILKDGYFGKEVVPNHPAMFPKDNPVVKKYEIKIQESVLVDLKERLKKTRYVDPLDNVQFQYGFHASYLKQVVDYWLTKFDWRKQEKELNKFNHFTTQIEGMNVHFIHQVPDVKGRKVKIIPLLLIHGWPGSIVEFTKILPLLTTPRKDSDFVFEVICPSIPGYGFSEAPQRPGFSVTDAGRVFTKLMDRLQINQFYVQGGDWGAAIATDMTKIYPERILGVHVTMVSDRKLGLSGWAKYIFGYLFPSTLSSNEEYDRYYAIPKIFRFCLEEMGYAHIQATKPDTIGSALMDSPSGLAAYILEKYSTWTDRDNREAIDGGLTKKFTIDELLTNVMIYWSTNTIASSMRFYKERFSEKELSYNLENVPIKRPSGIAVFPHELLALPQYLLTSHYRNLVRYTIMPRGGHFGAMEEPGLLSDEVFAFVKDVEKIAGEDENKEKKP